MRQARFLWHIGVAMLIAALLTVPTAAASPGATLRARDATITVNADQSQATRTEIGANGSEQFVGAGFGPGELVSVYITFPDGRVFPVSNGQGSGCCPRDDQTLADGTGGIFFEVDFGQAFPSTTGSAPSNVQFTSATFLLPDEFATGVPGYGRYAVTALGRVSLQKATATFTIVPPGPPGRLDGDIATTGTLSVFTTIGHKTSAKQVDPQLAPTGVSDNPNVDIACNGLIPGELVAFWDTYPDGTAIGLSTLVADDGGSAILQLDLLTGKFPTGLHTFTCRGETRSNYVMTGSFLLLPGGIGSQSSIGTLTVSYVGAPQAVANATFPQLPGFFAGDYLLLTARNFRPNETVTFWQTFPDQTAHFLATVKANQAGVAVVAIQLFPGPINYQSSKAVLGDSSLYLIAYPAGVDGRIPAGRQYFSARGDTTQRTASSPFDLVSSQVDP